MVHDTRAVTPGALFCCVPGRERRRPRPGARRGRRRAPPRCSWSARSTSPLPQLLARSVRDAMGPIADAFWGHPSESLTVVGVTGTSGKTTTTHLLHVDLRGARLVVVGARHAERAPHHARGARAAGAPGRGARRGSRRRSRWRCRRTRWRWAACAATRFAVAVFTNLSHDHLDFHRDLEDYFEAKATLFTRAVHRRRRREPRRPPRRRAGPPRARCPPTGYSLADADDLVVGTTSCTFRWRGHAVALPLGGRFNVSNALAAATAAARLGIPDATIAAGPGRGAAGAGPVRAGRRGPAVRRAGRLRPQARRPRRRARRRPRAPPTADG